MRISAVSMAVLLVLGGPALAQGVAPLGGQFQINSYTTATQRSARVACNGQGDFVVVWNSVGSSGTDTSYSSVQARRFRANGVANGNDFQVNTYTHSNQDWPNVAVGPQEDFVVVWQSMYSAGSDARQSIHGQLYDGGGTPIGSQFQINSYTTDVQLLPSAALDSQGRFVVVWFSLGSYGTDNSGGSVQGQRFDESGTPDGGQFQVNTYWTDWQRYPAVAADGQGDFIVAWQSKGSYGTDSSQASIQAQFYDASGKPAGGQFQVNTYTYQDQRAPSVSEVDSEGNFVVVWESRYGSGTDNYWSVQAQRFASRPVMVDSFESGDLSAWSNIVQ